MMHSIGDNKRTFNISSFSFDRLLHFLSSKNVISLGNMNKETDYYALSFDDVRDSFYYNGYPLLKKYHVPFTAFVTCSLLDTEGHITTDQLKILAQDPLCTIGSHGLTHTKYVYKNRMELEYEFKESKQVLESITGIKVNLFAFPYGSFAAVGLSTIKFGLTCYDAGFSTISIPVTVTQLLPASFLPRINVTEKNLDKIIRS